MEFVRLDDCPDCATHRATEPTPIPGWARHLMHLTERNHRAMTSLATAMTDLTQVVTELKDALPSTHDQVGNQIEAAVTELRALVDGLKAVPTPATAPPAAAPTASGKPLYEHVGVDPFDPASWPVAVEKTPAGAPLYEFAADVAGGPATGGGPEWTVYTGPTA